jgi:hypothetical protein
VSRSARPRVNLDDSLKTLAVGDRRFPIGDTAAYHVLARLVRARGKVVKGRTLREKADYHGDFKKLLNRLPDDLKPLVKSRRGAGGGFWLDWPGLLRLGINGHQ